MTNASDIALIHPRTKNIAEDTSACHAHGVGDGNDALRHGFGLRRGLRSGWPSFPVWPNPRVPSTKRSVNAGPTRRSPAGNERLRTVQPSNAVCSFFEQHGGDGRGRHLAQNIESPDRSSFASPFSRSIMPAQCQAVASRRRSHATNGIDNSTIQALHGQSATARKSSEPKASHRNTVESDQQADKAFVKLLWR